MLRFDDLLFNLNLTHDMHIILPEVVTQIENFLMMSFWRRKLTFEFIYVIQPLIKFNLNNLVTIRRLIIQYKSYQQHAYHLVWSCDPDWQLLHDIILTKKTDFWVFLVIQPLIKFYLNNLVTIRGLIIIFKSYQQHA